MSADNTLGEQPNGKVETRSRAGNVTILAGGHTGVTQVSLFHLAGGLPSVSHREVVHGMNLAPDGRVFGVSFHLPNTVCWVAGCGTLSRSTSRCHTAKPIEPIKSEIWPKGGNAVSYQDFNFWLFGVNVGLIRVS